MILANRWIDQSGGVDIKFSISESLPSKQQAMAAQTGCAHVELIIIRIPKETSCAAALHALRFLNSHAVSSPETGKKRAGKQQLRER